MGTAQFSSVTQGSTASARGSDQRLRTRLMVAALSKSRDVTRHGATTTPSPGGGGEAEHRWRYAIGAPEAVRQMALVGEAGGGGDRGQCLACLQQAPRPRETALQDVEMWRRAGLAPEYAQEMPAAHPRLGGE